MPSSADAVTSCASAAIADGNGAGDGAGDAVLVVLAGTGSGPLIYMSGMAAMEPLALHDANEDGAPVDAVDIIHAPCDGSSLFLAVATHNRLFYAEAPPLGEGVQRKVLDELAWKS